MQVKILEQRHPEHHGDELELLRALYCGGEEWREHLSTWLPQHTEESDTVYEERKKHALYTNHSGPLVDLLAGAVFAEAPQVEGLPAAWGPTFLANVDREGATAQQWFAARLVDALVERRVYAWVNLPARAVDAPVPASVADEEAAGYLDAFLVPFRAEHVIDWERDENGRLAWLMVRDCVERRAGVESPRTSVHRWTYIDRTQIRRWTWTPRPGQDDPNPEDDAVEQPAVAHGLGELPVAVLELSEGLHAMGKLRDPAIAHLRARNDLSWALHRAAHALLVIKSEWDDKRPILGPGRWLQLGQKDEIEYVEPSGANFALLAEDLVQLREEIYRVVQQMAIGADSNASRSKQSGESKAADWRAMEIVLAALAERVRPFMVDVLRLVAKARAASVVPTVAGLDGWQQEDLEVWLASAALATDAHRLSPTFTKEVAKRQAGRLLQGVDKKVLATVSKEIDDAEAVDPAPYVPPPAPKPGAPPEVP